MTYVQYLWTDFGSAGWSMILINNYKHNIEYYNIIAL
jgi:hypothetical protein